MEINQQLYVNKNTKQAVFVSKLNRQLLPQLADFISQGLQRGDLCLTALTARHRRSIFKALRAKGVDIQAAIRAEQYFNLNPRDLDTEFDEETYRQKIKEISTLAAWEGQRIRAFGEIVGLRLPRLRFYVPQHE